MRRSVIAFLVLLLAGCAARQALEEGRALIQSGNPEAGLARINEAAQLDPGNYEYRQQYFVQRDAALQRYLGMAETARMQGLLDEAESLYRRMLTLDAQNVRARVGLETIDMERRHQRLLHEADALMKEDKIPDAQARARQVLTENSLNRDAQLLLRRIEERLVRDATAAPELSAALKRPVALELRDVPVRAVFDLISKQSGVTFMFDRDVRADLRTSISSKNASLENVLRYLLVTNQLDKKVLADNMVLIYPNVPPKQREYQELVVKTFYLANADPKLTANLLRTVLRTRDIHVDEKLNLLVLRDTPEAIRMAERLVANQDMAEPEVMLEVEVLEVGSSLLSELGIRWPEQVSYSIVGAAGTPGTITLPEWHNRNASMIRMSITNPLLVINLRNQAGRSNLLANPRIRVKNKDKAKVHIGDKVPVITTTTTATGFVSESVTYLDVGLKLEVEPTISLDEEVGIKVSLEVSNIVREIRSGPGTLTYQVGTRNASTALRLRDGETQILAGLISDEDRNTATRVPGLGELPVVGRLFSSHADTTTKTEIVLLITPRIMRTLARPALRYEEFAAGTEASMGAAPIALQPSTPPAIVPPSRPPAVLPPPQPQAPVPFPRVPGAPPRP